MRTTLLPGLLTAALRNIGRGSRDVAAFEVGRVFLPGRDELPAAPVPGIAGPPTPAELVALDAALPRQPLHVGAIFTGHLRLADWSGPAVPAAWSDAVAAAQAVAAAVGVSLSVTSAEHAPWHPGRCAALTLNGELVGFAGELHPRVVKAHDLPDGAAAMELDLDQLLMLAGAEAVRAPNVSAYPPVARDVALVVDSSTPAAVVEAVLREGAGSLLESLRLFDLYAGEQVAAGSRSLAYRLVLRAPDRTLTDGEANAARDAAVALVTARTGATVRV
jgi:phenylalanyl-tRNA synthetase beta chain